VLNLKSGVLENSEPRDRDEAVFLAFWDFDGTLLKGDCSEGCSEDGTEYTGLAQVCIEHGFSKKYASEGGFQKFWEDYQMLDERFGHWLAYPYIPQMLEGTQKSDVIALAADHFRTTLGAHYFASSVTILRALESAGIRNYVISASADVFVDAASETLGLPVDRFHGIEVQTNANGQLTHDLIAPVTWAQGKVSKLQQILSSTIASIPGKPVYVICGFGNSFSTDGPFLEFISRNPLPGGLHGLAVMINGGNSPERFTGRFIEVSEDLEMDLRNLTE